MNTPILRMVIRPPGEAPPALMFQLPSLLGSESTEIPVIRALRAAADEKAFAGIPQTEREASLGALAEVVRRALLHKAAFDRGLSSMRQRREVLGGPAICDWEAVVAIQTEALAFLVAARTVVDQVVRLGARRAGHSLDKASKWEATTAILPRPEQDASKHDVPEVRLLRARASWYTELNEYRNLAIHAGWRAHLWGYFEASDTAPEARDPQINAMLVPDLGWLQQRPRPSTMTFSEGRRLDTLVESACRELVDVTHELVTQVWSAPIPPPGSIPAEEHANAMLLLPRPVMLITPANAFVIPIFEHKTAAQRYSGYGAHASQLELRAVRRTSFSPDRCPAFLLAIPPQVSQVHVVLHGLRNGVLAELSRVDLDPQCDGPVPNVIAFEPACTPASALYVWQERQ